MHTVFWALRHPPQTSIPTGHYFPKAPQEIFRWVGGPTMFGYCDSDFLFYGL
jgi:hypothetical protein